MRTRMLSALLAPVLAAPLLAQSPAEATLHTRVADGVVRAALEIDIEPGWHIYHGPTQADLGHPKAIGSPTEVTLSGEGIEWSPVRFPEPYEEDQSDFGPGIFIYAHEGRIVLYAAGRLGEGATGEDVSAKIKGLVCQESCIPYREEVESEGAGPDALFADFPSDLVAPAPRAAAQEDQAPLPAGVPSVDDKKDGNADGTLYVRVEGSEVRAAIVVDIQPGWHLYNGPTKADLGHPEAIGTPTVVTLHGEGVRFGKVVFPEPIRIDQSFMGKGVYILGHEGRITFYARGELEPDARRDGKQVWAEITGQTCDPNVCVNYAETLANHGRGADAVWSGWDAAMSAAPVGAAGTDENGTGNGADDEQGGLLAFLLLAVGGGLFALAMPCTYPMIPITISFFTKQADSRGGNVLPLSLAYGAGIVLIFIVIGVVFGSLIIPFATNPVTNLVIGLAFLYFAAVLFGWVQMNPPRFLMNAAGKASMKGGVLGVFLMGATLVVTSFTCTAPFVGSLLSVGARDGNLGRVALGMGVFGLTMAIPFVILSLVPGRIQAIPRSGEWMNTLKHFLGFVEVAASLKFLSNTDIVWHWFVLSREVFLLLWALIFAAAALYLFGAFEKRGLFRKGMKRMTSGALCLLFALYCTWGMFGKPLDGVMTAFVPNYSGGVVPISFYTPAGSWTIVKDDYDGALELAKKEKKLLFVNFTGFT